MGCLGPSIFWRPMLIGGTDGSVPVQTGVVVMGVITAVFLSRRIGSLVSFPFTTGGSFRTTAVLRIAPVTISLWRTALTACKALPLVATPSVVVWLTSGMTNGMIAGIYWFVNNLCGNFPLVVSVSVIFLFFLSLV